MDAKQQEQFEADYLAAFPNEDMEFARKIRQSRGYYYSPTRKAFAVWLQQAKRHEAEIAELVVALKFAHTVMRQWKPILPPLPAHLSSDRDLCIQEVGAIIAKYEVKK